MLGFRHGRTFPTMKRALRALAFLAMLLPGVAAAQCNSSTPLAANTVLGRLGTGPGPCQAIPFATLGPSLITSNLAVTGPLSISGLNLSITGVAGKVLAGAGPAFTHAPTLGVASSLTGALTLANAGNVGTVTLTAPSTATTWTCKLPTTTGSNGQALITDGANPCQLTWAAGTGTVNSGTAGQIGYYATTAAALSGNSNLNISTGALTVGQAGSVVGSICFGNATSGAACIVPATGALGAAVATLAAGTYNIVGDSLTQTLTNKTLTSPTLNSPTMTTPTLGVASATSINKVAITAPATGSTLTIADGKTLTDTSGIGASVLLGTTGGGFTAYAGGSCTNQFIRSLSAAAVVACASVANTDLTNSSVTIGSTNVALGATAATLAGLTLTSPVINGGTATALTSLGIRSAGAGAFDVVIANTETLTAQRQLTLTLNNAARTVSLSGNLTLAGGFTTAGPSAITLTATGATNVTLPTGGTLATLDQAETFSAAKIFSSLTQFTDIKMSSGKIYPTADGTTALQILKADGTTRIVNFDTTNARVGINKSAGAFDLDVNGAVNVGGRLTFSTLDGASLQASPSTITDMTVNNSPNASNDYIPYYNAAAGQWRRGTVGSIAAGATAGVSSLNGLTGGLSIVQGFGTLVSASGSSVTASVTAHDPGSITNCTLVVSVSGNALTGAIKTQAGVDPTATAPCSISFPSNTVATGDFTPVNVTAPTSFVTGASGSTFGSANNVAFKLYWFAANNAGTVVLGAMSASTPTRIYGVDDNLPKSTTACSACTNATAAGTYYTTAALTTKAIRVIGVSIWESGLATAGTWASGPTSIRLRTPGMLLPGQPTGNSNAFSCTANSYTTNATAAFVASAATTTITPLSAANFVSVTYSGEQSTSTASDSAITGVLRGGTLTGPETNFYPGSTAGSSANVPITRTVLDFPQATTSTTYAVGIRSSAAAATAKFGSGVAAGYCTINVAEIVG